MLEQGTAQPLSDAADDLPFGDRGVDQSTGVADHDVALQTYRPGFGIDIDHNRVYAVSKRRNIALEVVSGFEARQHAGWTMPVARATGFGELGQ